MSAHNCIVDNRVIPFPSRTSLRSKMYRAIPYDHCKEVGLRMESFTKEELADNLGVTPDQIDEVVAEYQLPELPENVSLDEARVIVSRLNHACTVFGLTDQTGGHTPPHRPSWVQRPGEPVRHFPQI